MKAFAVLALWGMSAATSPQTTLPNPEIFLWRIELYSTPSGSFMRYWYRVANKAKYPADLFIASPGLPPCGLNTKASRTWVDVFDAAGKRIYGFCALTKPADLDNLWFAIPKGEKAPAGIYIEMHDRLTNLKYRSKVAPTQF